jgi:hypothetical protein
VYAGVVDRFVIATAWPVVLMVCPPELSSGWLEALDAGFAAAFAREQPFAVLADTSRMTSIPSARDRARMAEWASKPAHIELQKRYCVGTATIVQNALMRGTMQAIFWLYTPPAPQNAVRDFDEAWRWCIGKLETRGVDLPSPAADLRRIAVRELATAPAAARAR